MEQATAVSQRSLPHGFLLFRGGSHDLGNNMVANNVRSCCLDGAELEGTCLTWGDFGNWS